MIFDYKKIRNSSSYVQMEMALNRMKIIHLNICNFFHFSVLNDVKYMTEKCLSLLILFNKK